MKIFCPSCGNEWDIDYDSAKSGDLWHGPNLWVGVCYCPKETCQQSYKDFLNDAKINKRHLGTAT
jgi:hypothetical protein